MYKVSILTMTMALSVSLCCAESFEEFARAEKERYSNYKDNYERELKEFRDKQNAAYANLMRQSWSREEPAPPIPQPEIPEPPKPMVADPDVEITTKPMAVGDIVKVPKPVVVTPPKPVVPTPKVEEKPKPTGFSFKYYGTQCSVDFKTSQRFTLSDVDEDCVADAWSRLSDDSYVQMVTDCLAWRDALSLSDWGYVRFVDVLSQAACGKGATNEAKVMQLFILVQSGYEARIARADEELFLLLPFTTQLYEFSYLNIEGGKYYIIGKPSGNSFYVFNQKFPNEQRLSLQLANSPKLDVTRTKSRRIASKRYASVAVEYSANQNLIDFYNDFPRSSDWSVYSTASLSSQVKESIYPTLKREIAGKSQQDAANILLNFVQTSLEYQTDGEQFGYERPLFADESLVYPYCDCEDRSILLSVLVRELMGLEVVFLQYPKHLATAIGFTESVAGDYLTVEGKRFVVSDPTYIGAKVGQTMPEFRSTKAEVIRF